MCYQNQIIPVEELIERIREEQSICLEIDYDVVSNQIVFKGYVLNPNQIIGLKLLAPSSQLYKDLTQCQIWQMSLILELINLLSNFDSIESIQPIFDDTQHLVALELIQN